MSLSPSEAPLKGIALNPIGQKQYIDHLAPASILLGIPLLFHTEEDLQAAKKFYPGLKCLYLPFEEFSPEWVIAHYDFSLLSDQWHRDSLHAKFELLEMKYGKKMRNLHCPHGYSDKGFYLKDCAFEDICMVYGNRMLKMFDEWEVAHRLNPYLLVGNYRYHYFLEHKEYLTSLVEEEVLGKFEELKPLILYAPTCVDQENATSFFEATELLIKKLPAEYNLIVKLHPRLEEDNPAKFLSLIAKYEGNPNVLFLNDFPLIYPLLSKVDIYIGDVSSVGYDFLAFDRPMFFLNQLKKKYPEDGSAYLFQCGTVVNPEDYSSLFSIMEKALPQDKERFSRKRGEIGEETFERGRTQQNVRGDLKEILAGKIPPSVKMTIPRQGVER